MKLKDLAQNPNNPRKISEDQLKRLHKSLEFFGDLSGIIYNKKSGHLISGHQRSKALPDDSVITIEHKYKKPTAAGTVAEGFIDIYGERFKYREVQWDSRTENAAMVAANAHGGEWDYPMLTELLLDLDSINIPLDVVGFSDEEAADIIAPTKPPKKKKLVNCPKCDHEFEC